MNKLHQVTPHVAFKYFLILIILIGVLGSFSSSAEASPISISNNEFISRIALNLQPNNILKESNSLDNPIGCGVAELVDAIDYANTNPGPDTIELTSGCLYQLNSSNNFDLEYQKNGLPVITSSITINGNGAVISSSVDNLRAFQVSQDASLSINNLEFNGLDSDDYGGAILNHGTLTINQVTFSANAAIKGGAIYNAGQAEISNSTFAGNRACC